MNESPEQALQRISDQRAENLMRAHEEIDRLARLCEAKDAEIELRAKETEPLRREVAMLLRAEQCPNCDNVGWYQVGHEENEQCEFCYTNPKSIYNVHRDLQGSALAYDREVENRGAVKALENIVNVLEFERLLTDDEQFIDTFDDGVSAVEKVLNIKIAELRAANKGEVK